MLPKFLIIETGFPPPLLSAKFGSFADMFLRVADFSRCQPVCLNAQSAPLPDRPGDFAGALITGSPAMVTDREPWSEALAAWLCRAIDAGLPLLGVCYGHQLLAHALGGEVGYHPKGLELGTHQIRLALRDEAEEAHPLLRGLPSEFAANLSHSQSVLALPAGARALAGSSHDPHQIIAYAPHIVGLQFHPEFSREIMQTYAAYKTSPAGQGTGPVSLGLPITETPEARSVLQRFVDTIAPAW